MDLHNVLLPDLMLVGVALGHLTSDWQSDAKASPRPTELVLFDLEAIT